MLEQGADPHATGPLSQTPLHMAACVFLSNGLDSAKLLCDKNVNINAQDSMGRTPLHRAADKSNPALVDLLLKKGADPTIKNKLGQIPLHNAAMRDDLKVVMLLNANNTHINAQDDKGLTPLHWAVWNLNPIIIDYFLKNGADTNILTVHHERAEDLIPLREDRIPKTEEQVKKMFTDLKQKNGKKIKRRKK